MTRTYSLMFAFLIMFLQSTVALAVPLIRDAEIEHVLRGYADPIFRAAGVNPSTTKIFIVQDSGLNAYVAGGANMFINSGLIMAAETPDILIGVMAHETGHIAGGHLIQGTEKIKNAQLGTVLTFVLGAASAAVSKKPEAAAAIITGGQNTIARNFFSYTRANEQAADQSAMTTLDKLGISANGMIKMFDMLKRNERRQFGAPDPYMLTHPLTNDRIEFVRNHVEKSKIPSGQYPKSYLISQQRIVAKLYGFIQTPERTLQKYPTTDKSVPARIARAVAYYRMPNIENSLVEVNSLIEEAPKDPFFHELKGQILFENGRTKEALESYKESVNILPNSALLLADLGKVEISQKTPQAFALAIAHLKKSVSIDDSNPAAWRLLATAYGSVDNMPMSYLALAEEALLQNDTETAIRMANLAISNLKDGSPAHRRANDVKNKAEDMKKQEDDKNSPF